MDKDRIDDKIDLLSAELDFIGNQARHYVVDAVFCTLFNKAGTLEGNTEASDVEWFARNVWQAVTGRVPGQWELMSEDNREFYRKVARASLQELPSLMSRIAHRCRIVAEALNSLRKAEMDAERRAESYLCPSEKAVKGNE